MRLWISLFNVICTVFRIFNICTTVSVMSLFVVGKVQVLLKSSLLFCVTLNKKSFGAVLKKSYSKTCEKNQQWTACSDVSSRRQLSNRTLVNDWLTWLHKITCSRRFSLLVKREVINKLAAVISLRRQCYHFVTSIAITN